jgi:type IV pilus assembly protein PilV
MKTSRQRRFNPRGVRQRGSFLLEALIAILIVAFGILGLLGLEANALQNVDDAQYRSEAVALANSYIGQMWIADQTTLSANFSDTAGAGTPYDEFKKVVAQRLPGASGARVPQVTVTPAAPPAQGTQVTITVLWNPPGAPAQSLLAGPGSGIAAHRYIATATVNSTN